MIWFGVYFQVVTGKSALLGFLVIAVTLFRVKKPHVVFCRNSSILLYKDVYLLDARLNAKSYLEFYK